ncbi:HET-domain-containing protein, partial [Pyrenochaeta sp. DS3sAY3a]
LPTRVLDVGTPKSGDSVRLIVTAGACGYWVALSHCWGEKENHPLKTTRKNISEHLTRIDMSSLPKTFQDAVVTTRALGFRYLWIDSLCIVQDDEEEWRNESHKMATIYEHAVLTLAASAAKDSKQGLFVERPYGKIKYPSTQLPFIKRDPQTGENNTLGEYSISLDWRQEPFMEHMDPMFSPIYRRGWCTQEFILSRRIIHFLDEGMMWVCKERAVDETGHFVLAAKRHSDPDWATEWHKIITDHSVRDFTFESDRLVSLDGLAREVAKAENNSCKLEEYFYGTWLSDVPESILWASYRAHDRETACPSWSWAS